MNKAKLVDAISENTGMTKQNIDTIITAMIDVVGDTLSQGEKIVIQGLGTFEVKQRADRQGYNPQNDEMITIPGKKAATFKASKILKNKINEEPVK